MHNFFADFRKGGDFLKSYWAKWSRKQVAFFLFWTVKGAESNISHMQTPFVTVIFKTLGQIKSYSLIHEPQKRQIPKLSRAIFTCKLRDNTRAWSWLLSRYYMKRTRRERLFLYRDWKQCAWAVCYPLSCLSLGSFAGPPGKRDYLENFHAGSRHHNTGMPVSRAGSVFWKDFQRGLDSTYSKQLFLTHWQFKHFELEAFTILSLVN